MADNVSDALKNLNRNLKEADTNLATLSKNFHTVFAEAVRRAAQDAGADIGRMFDSMAGKVGAAKKANKLKMLFEIVDEHGAEITPQKLKAKIDRIANAAVNKEGTKIHLGFEWVDYEKAMTQLERFKQQYNLLKDLPGVYDTALRLSNQSVGGATVSGTALGRARTKEMGEVQKYTKLANDELLRQQQIEQKIAEIRARGGKSAQFEGERRSIAQLNNMLEDSRRQVEAYKRTLQGLGTRGRAAAAGFGGDGSRTAIKEQTSLMRELYNLTKQYRQMQDQQQTGKVINPQDLEDTRRRLREILADMKRIEAEHPGSRKTAAARLETERLRDRWREVHRGIADMLPTIQRVASAFGIAFSIQGLVQFGKKLVETRGEFELQQVALRSILQNKQVADEIWDKTMQAALQSPFTAMQLTKYTKQLAAYRIETDKLFDTTKRLADVSAGLGVDMGRLILAYGQVKAANYLRASEIRQFTEAGVNILGELAEYLSLTRKESISTAQVMDMVQKRMVKFEDVEAIFKRMTDEGGIFYNMQYVQSQTVKGQINKLHDAYDQMLNSIGKANEGTLKNMFSLLNNIVKNWREWKTVLDLIAWPLLINLVAKFSRGLLTSAASAVVLKKEMNAVTRAGARMQIMFSNIGKLIKANPWLALAGAVASVGFALYNHNKQVKAYQAEIEEQNLRLYDTQQKFKQYQKTVEENNIAIKENSSANNENRLSTEQLNEKKEKNREILEKLKKEYPDLVKNIQLEKDGTVDLTKALSDYNEELERLMTLENILSQSSGTFSWLNDTYGKNLTQYVKKLSVLKGELISAQATANKIQMRMHIAGEENLPFFNKLQEIKDLDLSDIEEAAKQYRRILYSLFDFEADGESDIKKTEKVSGAEKYGKDLPYLSEFNFKVGNAESAMLENMDIFKSMFESQVRSFSEYSQKIKEEYNGNVEAFIEDNRELIKNGIIEGDADVVSSIRNALQTLGGATTEEAKVWYNKLLNEYLVFHNAHERITQLEAQISAERDKKIRNRDFKLIQHTKYEIESIRKEIANQEPIDFFATPIKGDGDDGGGDEDGKGDKTKENASRMISLLKEMNSEYEKLSKSAYGYAKSEATVRESYKQSVKEILGKAGITDYDFTTNAGMIEALEKVKEYATKLGPEAAAEVQKYIDQLETGITINAQVRIREDFGRQMEEAFGNYELTLDLQKLNIPEDAVKDLFPDFDYTSIGALQDIMEKFYNDRQKKDEKGNVLFSKDDLDAYKKWSDKIDSEILKMRKEKAQQYSKYLEKEYSERAKVEMKYAKDVAFVTANVSDDAQRKNILSNLQKKYQDDINELNWKSFKESDFYVEMMEDITSLPKEYTQMMLDKINEILQHPETLSPRALKEAINARQKVLDAQMNLEPLDVMRTSVSQIRTAMNDVGGTSWKDTKEKIYEQVTATQEQINELEEEARCWDETAAKMQVYEDAVESVSVARGKLGSSTTKKLEEEGASLESILKEYKNLRTGFDEERQQLLIDFKKENLTDEEDAIRKQLVDKGYLSEGGELTSNGKDRLNYLDRQNSYYQEQIDLLNELIDKEKELQSIREGQAGTDAEMQRGVGGVGTAANARARAQEARDEASEPRKRIQSLKDYLKAFTNFNESFAKFNAAINSTLNAVAGMGNAFYDMFDALGGKTDALTEGWKEFGNTMISSITNALTMIPMMVAAFTAAGIAINSAMGIIGLIAEALNLLMTAITAISKLHDAGYEKEIENQQKKIDELKSAYERLEKAIEKTWTTMTYIDTYNQQVENIKQQIEALEAQRRAENSKKNTDEDKIREYGDSIQEAYDELEELEQKRIEVFGGLGEVNYRSAAEEFVSAWKDAFLETGDGLEALQEHFDEFLQEWFVKQATMRIAGAMLERTFRMIDESVNESSEGGVAVTMAELQAIRDEFATQAPLISEALEELAGMFDFGNGEGSLSGLAAGIQGMTEEQANILEAYWNSVRMYTANIDGNVERIANILGAGGSATNPQLQQLQIIAQHTQAIHTLLDNVTRSGHPQGGLGIKVFNN